MALLLMLSTGCASRVPIRVRNAGYRGLDLRFAAILKQTFGNSTAFRLTSGTASNTLVATTQALRQIRVGNHVEIRYAVDVARCGKPLGVSSGQCREELLARCAAIVVKDTRFFLDGGR
ncbi:MAG: hypothetical protein ACRETK_05195 [Steroidobacteraceae bacterium]